MFGNVSTIPYAVLDAIVDIFFMTLEETRKGNRGRNVLYAVMEPFFDELRLRNAIIRNVENKA
jgi:hypothetical protein